MKISWKLGICLAGMAVLLGGCQHMTEEQIVVQKSAIAGARAINEESAGTVAEQVKVTEGLHQKVRLTGGEGVISIMVDADVKVPVADGIRLKRVETRLFETKDLENIQKSIMKGNPIYQREFTEQQRENNVTFTKGEIQSIVDNYEIEMESYESVDREYWDYLYEKMEQAPNYFSTVNIPIQVHYDKRVAESYRVNGENHGNGGESYQEIELGIEGTEKTEDNPNILWGGVDVDGVGFNFMLNNNWNQDRKMVYALMVKGLYEEGGPSTMYGTDLSVSEIFPEFQTPEIQLEYAKEEGKRVLEELGCEDMQMVDEIYDSTRYNEFKAQDEESIMLHFTRVIDGIPITYTDSRRTVNITNTAGDVSEQVDFSESFSMNFDEEGLAQIYWKNPAKIYDMSDEYVFLMPFSEIWNIFKKEAIAANTEDFAYMMQRDINISKIELGYMWLPDTSSDSDKEGTLIPVWDFLGTSSTIYDYSEGIAEEKYIDQVDLNLPNQSFLTINAMDGSIVYAPAPVF